MTTDTILVPDTYHLYTCSGSAGRPGHELGSPTPLRKCPSYWLGSPCKGTLTQYGKGSRKAAK